MIARSRAAPALRRSISSIPAVWKNSERARTIVWAAHQAFEDNKLPKRVERWESHEKKRHLSASPPGFLSPDEAEDLVKNKKALLIDVREEYEFAEGHASLAVNISVSDLMERLPDVEKLASKLKNKDTPIVVYCRMGGRASNAQVILQQAGYKEVYNLGGIIQASAAFDFWGSGSSVGPP